MAKTEVKSKDSAGNEVVVYVIKPRPEHLAAAKLEAAKAFRDAVKRGDFFRDRLDEEMRSQGLWDDEKQKELDKLDKNLETSLLKLQSGGIKLSEAFELCKKIRTDRTLKILLEAVHRQFDRLTVEAQKDNASFDCLVSLCVLDDEGNNKFESLEDYRSKQSEPYAAKAAAVLAAKSFGLEEDWQKDLPENKFMLKYKFVDNDLNFIDKEGKLVDFSGRRVNADGQLLNEDGLPVNEDGQRIDENGDVIVEAKPFLDEDGNPLE